MNKKLLITVAIFSAAILTVFAGWWILFGVVKNEKNIMERARAQFGSASDDQLYIMELERMLQDIKEADNTISAVFLQKQEIVKAIELLENIASKTNTALVMESVAANSKSSGPVFQFRLFGDFSDVFLYLMLMENAPHRFHFSEILFQKKSDNDSEWESRFKAELLSYIDA